MSFDQILFAPVLKAEGWTSIDLQQNNILDALKQYYPDLPVEVLNLPERWAHRRMVRRFLKDVYYPQLIREKVRGKKTILHISDHSYGHLCKAHVPNVINCNDLHHHVHPDLPPLALWRWRQRVAALRKAARVLTVSEHLADEVREYLKLPASQVCALPGGIDVEVFNTSPTSLAEAAVALPEVAALRDEYFLIANIGTNIARKNLPTVIRALQQLVQVKRLPVKLVKAGPPLKSSIHELLIQELGLGDSIVDLGLVPPEKVAALCHLSHVLSFASFYEGFGRPTLEAQACSLPCVLADASCMREIGGAGALYHEPLSVDDLTDKLESCFTNQQLRDTLIAKGLQNVERYSWQIYSDQLKRVYSEVSQF